ncbi:NAD(P)H-dependent flavin oxidoreductase [Croceicoccus sediminis]|uniref:NAD(P)H-dependent flavin oxidoreductase n=1 Tax=Croceicoccus sediminis TaxID=2571150 RepID=UPI0011838A97|nr:nitronate monooxygenase [Croceicoccus sediminis]
MLGNTAIAPALRAKLALPVLAGPMFLVSGPELVIASCKAGIGGSFPTLNARTPQILDEWLTRISAELDADAAPYAANLIVHHTNPRVEDDLALIVKHEVPLVIASVGNPARVVDDVKGYGGLVFADVASVKHARRAAEAGLDGLILLCAGSGGHTGWLNPFAFVNEVRKFFAGPLVLAGALSNGRAIHAAEEMGADFAYVGTPLIAASESMAEDDYRQMLIESCADDIELTAALTGMPANMLRKSIERSGFTPESSHSGAFHAEKGTENLRAWRDIWSAGQGVGEIQRIEATQDIVSRMAQEYRDARKASLERLSQG